MKSLISALSLLLCSSFAFAQGSAEPFLGSWSLQLDGGAGWLNVEQEQGYLDAELLWYGGSVLGVAHAYVTDDMLTVTRVGETTHTMEGGKGSRTHAITNTYTFWRDGDGLKGKAFHPNRNGLGGQVGEFTGHRTGPMPPAPDLSSISWGEPIDLLANLDDWSPMGKNPNGWSLNDGILLNDPVQKDGEPHVYYANLRTNDTFEDFNLTLEVNVPKGSNSGVYLKGLYEIQVADTYGKSADSHNMGALYSRVVPMKTVEKPAGEWQMMDITLVDRHVTVKLNGETIIDNAAVEGVTGGAISADEMAPGPIYLQGDHGEVMYRNMKLRPAK